MIVVSFKLREQSKKSMLADAGVQGELALHWQLVFILIVLFLILKACTWLFLCRNLFRALFTSPSHFSSFWSPRWLAGASCHWGYLEKEVLLPPPCLHHHASNEIISVMEIYTRAKYCRNIQFFALVGWASKVQLEELLHSHSLGISKNSESRQFLVVHCSFSFWFYTDSSGLWKICVNWGKVWWHPWVMKLVFLLLLKNMQSFSLYFILFSRVLVFLFNYIVLEDKISLIISFTACERSLYFSAFQQKQTGFIGIYLKTNTNNLFVFLLFITKETERLPLYCPSRSTFSFQVGLEVWVAGYSQVLWGE